jgi:hypothetical protein
MLGMPNAIARYGRKGGNAYALLAQQLGGHLTGAGEPGDWKREKHHEHNVGYSDMG